MKKKSKFLIALILFQFAIPFLTSCKKEITQEMNGNVIRLPTSTNEDVFLKFEMLPADIKNQEIMQFANAMSKLISEDKPIYDFILGRLAACNYQEVLVSKIFSPTTQMDFYGKLSQKLQAIGSATNSGFNLSQFLNQNPLLTIRFPQEILKNGTYTIDKIAIPILVTNITDGNVYVFFGDEVTKIGSDAYAGLWLNQSEEYILYNLERDDIKFKSENFEESFLYNLGDFPKMRSYIASLEKVDNYSLINVLELGKKYDQLYLQSNSSNGRLIFSTNSNEINPSANRGGDGNVDCLRGSIEKDIILPQLKYNSTILEGFKLESYTNFLAIDNQPCNLVIGKGLTGQNLFSFKFTWVLGKNGGTAYTKNHRIDVLRKDLVDEKYVPYLFGFKSTWFLGLQPIIKYKIIEGTPKYVLINFPIFSTTKSGNHWTVDNQGDIFFINVQEFDTEICTSTNTSTNSTSISVGGTINFGELVKNPLIPGLTFNISKTTTYTQALVVNGVSIQDMGNTYFEYCQPFPNFVEKSWWFMDNWMQYNTTGAVKLELYSQWFE
jgi:hypothetical protein